MTLGSALAKMGAGRVAACPLCGARAPHPSLRLRNVPVLCNVLYVSEAAARSAPSSDIELVFCPDCALIYNSAFEPELVKYTPLYENPLDVSAAFLNFADDLSRRLVNEHDLRGGRAVEIGCGNGFFLKQLLENHMGSAVGYDPSMKGRPVPKQHGARLRIVPELFKSDHLSGQIDAIICRHVLEHLANPASFLATVRDAISNQTPLVYFEVPNAEWIVNTFNFWDVIYEHVTYWTPATLTTLFAKSAFTPISVTTGFGNQFLMMEARPNSRPLSHSLPPKGEVDRLAALYHRFAQAWGEISAFERMRLRQLKAKGETVVLWGAGSKGVTFANLIGESEHLLAGVVDVNPSKQGKHVGGCGLRVLAPDELKTLRPHTVLLMNENYLGEVGMRLGELGLAPYVRLTGLSPWKS